MRSARGAAARHHDSARIRHGGAARGEDTIRTGPRSRGNRDDGICTLPRAGCSAARAVRPCYSPPKTEADDEGDGVGGFTLITGDAGGLTVLL